MAVEETTTTTTHHDDHDRGDLLRKIAAAIVGIIVIILIVLAAKWIGDRVRERFFPPSPTNPIVTPTPVPSGYITPIPSGMPTAVPTYSHSPATGPEDYAYVIVGLMALLGFSTLALAKRK